MPKLSFPRIADIGRCLWRSSSLRTCSELGQWIGCPGPCYLGFKYLQEWKLQKLRATCFSVGSICFFFFPFSTSHWAGGPCCPQPSFSTDIFIGAALLPFKSLAGLSSCGVLLSKLSLRTQESVLVFPAQPLPQVNWLLFTSEFYQELLVHPCRAPATFAWLLAC